MDALETLIRTSDPDRYIASLFAPTAKRPPLYALYALNHELASIADHAREPMMAEIRLQWWRDALAEARAGKPRGHDVLQGMAEAFAQADLPRALFDAMIDARALDVSGETFADMSALETYADATSGNIMRLAAHILGEQTDEMARRAGIAYALAGILRAVPFHAARRKLFLPLDLLKAENLDVENVFAGHEITNIKRVFDAVSQRARNHLTNARRVAKPEKSLAAFLPASTVPAYLKLMTKRDFNPFRDRADIPMYRRQLAMLRASFRGRP
jgi:phytoene synthase